MTNEKDGADSKGSAPHINPIVAKAAALGPIRKNTWKRRCDSEQLSLFTTSRKKEKER